MLFKYDSFTYFQDTNSWAAEASCLGFKPGEPLPQFFKVQRGDVISEYRHDFTRRVDDDIMWWDYTEVTPVFDRNIRVYND